MVTSIFLALSAGVSVQADLSPSSAAAASVRNLRADTPRDSINFSGNSVIQESRLTACVVVSYMKNFNSFRIAQITKLIYLQKQY